ncbi:MAG: FtsW/RodA/SpoVE family cell cycle protein [Muribaculaceae bacterium]|nr:FtsW/RodA/SpoVE family cell cycle protein [Muribaculaceae bacterium]
MNQRKAIIGMAIVSVFFLIGTFTLYHNVSPYLDDVSNAYREHDACNLDENLTASQLRDLLVSHEYVKDTTDGRLIASWIVERCRQDGGFTNLGALNRNVNKIGFTEISTKGGLELKGRLTAARQYLGVADSAALRAAAERPSRGQTAIKVKVVYNDTTGGLGGLWNKLTGRSMRPVAGVPVRLTGHIPQVRDEFDDVTSELVSQDTVIAWAVTDEDGLAVLPAEKGKYYSVLPVKEGFEYGREKGTVDGPLGSRGARYTFVQHEHMLTPLSTSSYNRIKEDRALTVRTPGQWKDALVVSVTLFLLAWWIGLMLLMLIDRRLRQQSDYMLPVALMAMTAVSLLAMFAIVDPLVDRLLGLDMAWGVVYGVLALVAMSSINYVKFHIGQSRVQCGVMQFDFISQALRWMTLPFMAKLDTLRHTRRKKSSEQLLLNLRYYAGLLLSVLLLPVEWLWKGVKWIGERLSGFLEKKGWKPAAINWPQGIGYIVMAFLLVVLLAVFGSGPEGSGARVNLGPIQPSEVSKYLVVVFMAAFFAANSDRIRSYANDVNQLNLKFKFQLRTVLLLVVIIALLLLLYVVLISDMGPALVLMVTFILLYSVARGDFPQLVLGVLTFLALMIAAKMTIGSPLAMLMAALLWFAAWIGYGLFKGKKVYESAVMMNLLMVIFTQAGAWLTALHMSEGERLANRTAAAWSGVWNNEAPGGDQVAQGLWSLATGGWNGQGLGKGNASLVPAFNTDMIFTSIGEVMGWIVLVLILVCLVMIIHRSLLLARRAGHPFLFFLVSGIAIVTGVQFFVIVLGSVGLIPLTGVAVPLLSYGKSSLIMNLAAFGIVISCSRQRATVRQKAFIKQYDDVVITSSLTFITLSLLLVGTLFYYQVVKRDETLIRPAYVANLQGERIPEYNPRIRLLTNSLDAGNIYDRNGLLLATSSSSKLKEDILKLEQAGLDPVELKELSKTRLRRYYPFGDHLFFMLGDYNTRVLWNNNDANPYGYMAESRHLAELRGFQNMKLDSLGRHVVDTVTSVAYRYNRFLPSDKRVYCFKQYDYSALLPLLKSGIKSDAVKKWNEQRPQRDLTLTIDANLQFLMQKMMAENVAQNPRLSTLKRLRASVVVLDVNTGDLLTSACYPLPDQDVITAMLNSGMMYYRDYGNGFEAYTDRDLGLTFQTQPGSTAKVMSALAGFMKLGDAADQISYMVYGDERVESGESEPSGVVKIQDAIVRSSNNFFVHFVNDKDLYHELDSIYRMAGIRVHINDGRNHSVTPYFFDLDKNFSYAGEMDVMRSRALNRYNTYMKSQRSKAHERFNWNETGNAWGQHGIYATPLNMARVASMVAADGKFVPTRYVLAYGTGPDAKKVAVADAVTMTAGTHYLHRYMQLESDKHRASGRLTFGNSSSAMRMGGKTGTPERVAYRNGGRMNDAWYVCFINSNKQHGPLAIAVRLERTPYGTTSAEAVRFLNSTVIPALNVAGYELQ